MLERDGWRCQICAPGCTAVATTVDHIVPLAHGIHCVERLPNARLFTMEGESHLGGLGLAEEVLGGLLQEG